MGKKVRWGAPSAAAQWQLHKWELPGAAKDRAHLLRHGSISDHGAAIDKHLCAGRRRLACTAHRQAGRRQASVELNTSSHGQQAAVTASVQCCWHVVACSLLCSALLTRHAVQRKLGLGQPTALQGRFDLRGRAGAAGRVCTSDEHASLKPLGRPARRFSPCIAAEGTASSPAHFGWGCHHGGPEVPQLSLHLRPAWATKRYGNLGCWLAGKFPQLSLHLCPAGAEADTNNGRLV